MNKIVWLKAHCPICGRTYEYPEGGHKPSTCSSYDCLHKFLHTLKSIIERLIMDLNKLDKAYSEYEHYRRKILGNLTMASKLEIKVWEEWKIENGYEKKPASKKDTAKG